MIIKLGEEHREELLEFLKQDEDYNLYIIGDVENYVFNNAFQEVWGNFREGRLSSVLLRYYIFFKYYSPENEDVGEYIEIINKHDDFEVLSGKEECVEKFISSFDFRRRRKRFKDLMRNHMFIWRDYLVPIGKDILVLEVNFRAL